jgi:hypothetical protein
MRVAAKSCLRMDREFIKFNVTVGIKLTPSVSEVKKAAIYYEATATTSIRS